MGADKSPFSVICPPSVSSVSSASFASARRRCRRRKPVSPPPSSGPMICFRPLRFGHDRPQRTAPAITICALLMPPIFHFPSPISQLSPRHHGLLCRPPPPRHHLRLSPLRHGPLCRPPSPWHHLRFAEPRVARPRISLSTLNSRQLDARSSFLLRLTIRPSLPWKQNVSWP
jgi:hypothetical protein